ncbi:vWA domain-containing protein [Sorangium sp. So ce1000]|uniref:vWA domain-containing protein n=1 Tax=Sorangium sp. So ce1000 TaxID=3133325 RepID=UPI003F5E4A74
MPSANTTDAGDGVAAATDPRRTAAKQPDAASTGEAAEAPVRSVEIVISWGATVLLVQHLTPPRAFDVGEGRDDGRPCDCFLPERVLGTRRAPLVEVDGAGRVRFVLPGAATGTLTLTPGGAPLSAAAVRELHAGTARAAIPGATPAAIPDAAPAAIPSAALVPLPAHGRVDVEIAGVRIQIHADVAAGERARRSLVSRKSLALHAASAVLHLGLLGALARWAPPHVDPSIGMSDDRIALVRQYLASADERELRAALEREGERAAEPAADAKDAKEGGTGTRARGEEGSMGQPSSTPRAAAMGNVWGVMGPSDSPDPYVAREQALRDAAEFGMIGLLNAGSGGDPSAPTAPWGLDGATASGGGAGLPLGGAGGLGGAGRLGGAGGLGGDAAARGFGYVGTIGHGAGAGSGQGLGSGHGRAGASSPPVSAQGAVAYAPEPEAAIDPNGRFATTYRPGGGHLAAFEAALARGVVPAAERELVGDVGARYAPEVPLDPGKALGLRTDLERAALGPGGGAFHLRLALRSAAAAAPARPHLSVHLVLDTSGSMAGAPIDGARRAAQALVDRLAPADDFSLTTFSSDAEVVIEDGPVGPRRDAIRRAIDGLREGGGTNIGAGLSLGYAQASRPGIPDDAVRVVLLLSDGRATSGLTHGERLARLALDAFQRGIQTSALGLGDDFDGQLMSSIASDGAGGYYYLRHPEQIAPALSTELDKRLDPVATAVEVRVRLKAGVGLLRVYGSRRLDDAEASRVRAQEIAADVAALSRDRIAADRHDDAEGGMRFFMPVFARDDRHALLIKLSAGPGTGKRAVATVELKYKDRLSRKNVIEEIPIEVRYADSDAESAASVDASMTRTLQGFAAGESLAEAAARVSRGDRDGAAALLSEREGILREAATRLNEPLFLEDAARLSRLRAHMGAENGLGDPLVLAMLLETAGRSRLR